ncbi:MAG: flagellin lysine-N-methylase [Porcipelethomonas sp.]
MILRMPDYCREFTCAAEKCRDNCCCAGWEINIDEESDSFYRTIKGEFGRKLKDNITSDSPACIIPDKNGRCPFLNEKNLCEIIINLGEEHLCQICTHHPRYYSWFDGVKEGGTGLCCEESARIILSRSGKPGVWEREIENEESDYHDSELFGFMYSARERILDLLYCDDIPLGKRICMILDYGERLQLQADCENFILPEPETETETGLSEGNMKGILEFYMTLESLDENWKPLLENCIGKLGGINASKAEFAKACPQSEQYLCNITGYFIWRYFLNGVFGEEFLSAIKFSVVSMAVIGCLYVLRWLENGEFSLESCVETAKNYSKEIEYSEENVNAILDTSYENEAFSAGKLKGLIF